jgi:hypothetical protein
MATETRSAPRTDDEYLVLGRILMDQGFRDLFRHDPQAAYNQLGVSLSPDASDRIRRQLKKMDSLLPKARGAFTTRLNSMERWKQV